MGPLILDRSQREVILVTGADARTYLQGQITADVESLGEQRSIATLVLQPTGKVIAWGGIGSLDAATFVLDVEPGFASTVVDRLRRFLLRVDASVADPVMWTMVSARCSADDDAAKAELDGLSAALAATGTSAVRRDVAWPGGVVGFDLVGAWPDAAPALPQPPDPEALAGLRIRSGVPVMATEFDESLIPAELGVWFVDAAASFTKGCYVGQELVARIESRGSHTPRRLHVLAADGEIGVGEEVVDHAGDVVGHVTSAVGGSAVALLSRSVDAPCRLELRSGRAVEVSEPAAPGRG